MAEEKNDIEEEGEPSPFDPSGPNPFNEDGNSPFEMDDDGDEPEQFRDPLDDEDYADQPGPTGGEVPPPGEESGEVDDSLQYTDEQLARARDFGFDREFLKQMTPPAFEQMAGLIEYLAMGQVEDAPAEAQQQPGVGPGAEVSPGKLDLSGFLEDYPEETQEIFNKINDHYHEQIQSMQERIQNSVDAAQGESDRALEREYDSMIDGLGGDYSDILGEGPSSSLDPEGDHYSQRQELLEEMRAVQIGRDRRGLPGLSFEQLFKRAVGSVLGEHNKTIVRKEILSKVKDRGRQRLSRPNARKQVSRGSQNSTQDAVMAFCRANNIPFVDPIEDDVALEGFIT